MVNYLAIQKQGFEGHNKYITLLIKVILGNWRVYCRNLIISLNSF